MKIGKKSYIEYLFVICVVLEVFFMILSNFFSNSAMVLVYAIFFVEILAIIFAVFSSHLKVYIPQDEKILFFLFVLIQVFAYVFSSFKFGTVVFDLHKLLMCIGLIYATYFATQKIKCSEKSFDKIINFMLFIGLVATIYNFIENFQYFKSMDLSVVMYYTWNFNSFFSVRAVYAGFISICAIFSLLKSELYKKKIYLCLYVYFLCNILITAARAQSLAVIIATMFFLFHSKRYKKIVVFVGIIGGIVILIVGLTWFTELVEEYFMFFDHSQNRDTDFSTGRFELWGEALKAMDFVSMFSGYGLGSKDEFMLLKNIEILDSQLTSFHSGYIDLFFETGFLGLVFWSKAIIDAIRVIKKNCPTEIKYGLISVIILVLVSCLFDSCYMIFTTDTMSPVASFFVVALPITVSNYYRDNNNKVSC